MRLSQRSFAGLVQQPQVRPEPWVRAGPPQTVQLPDERVTHLMEVEHEATGQVRTRKGNFYSVRIDKTVTGQTPPLSDLLCVPRGLLKKIKQKVLVGDKVKVVGIDWPDAQGMVSDVFPRSSQLSDPAVANIDQILLVFSLSQPPFDAEQATRFLVVAEAAEIPAVVVLNKADLIPAEDSEAIVRQVESWGYKAITASANQAQGLQSLTEALSRQTSAVAGPSGVGKSSLINALSLLSHLQSGIGPLPVHADSAESPGDATSTPAHHRASQESPAAAQQGSPASADQPGASGSHHIQNPDDSSAVGASEPEVNSQGSPTSGSIEDAPGDPASSRRLDGAAIVEPRSQLELAQSRANLQGIDDEGSTRQSVGDITNIGRGRNTTREVTLLEIGDGLLADSPGFNQPGLEELTLGSLAECFPEIQGTLNSASCAFRNCQHLNEPGCGVRPGWGRHPFYVTLHAELSQLEELQRHRSASKKRREGHLKNKTQSGGAKQQEALLDRKSHRRVSRRQARQNMDIIIKDAAEDAAETP
ncbi:hypothetical protein WJX84_010095 [Apatococcus fuscideae]|uniref:Small ribosomal subunit biogenesis GTPase RsgA n=1 Tax=Apatococcus fuscideae TaxID=2026836 RepID=A0AAW1T9N8_9CHLO